MRAAGCQKVKRALGALSRALSMVTAGGHGSAAQPEVLAALCTYPVMHIVR